MPIGLLARKDDPVDLCSLVKEVKASLKGSPCGALLTFTGIVREKGADGAPVDHLEYEVFEDAARKSIRDMVNAVMLIEGVDEVALCHRYGSFKPGDEILYVVLATGKSQIGFDTLRLIVNRVKHELPIWKKEFTADGNYWIDVD